MAALGLGRGAGSAAQGLQVGDVAPPVEIAEWINPPEGKPPTAESLRGKLVMLEFWGTWCGPYGRAMPHVQELHDRYADRDLVVTDVKQARPKEARTKTIPIETSPFESPTQPAEALLISGSVLNVVLEPLSQATIACSFMLPSSEDAARRIVGESATSAPDGRIAFHDLDGFAIDEVGTDQTQALWLRGGFPRSLLATSDEDSFDWRRSFVQTFLERDFPELGIRIPSAALRRFWSMLAHYHAQIWNAEELARAFGASASTMRRHLDVLCGALVVRQLQPWHENIGKRQVKSPKIYISDSGLLHALLGPRTRNELEGHPKVGASWEGFVLNEIVIRLGAHPEECFFWATHSGADLDLLVVRGTQRRAFEIKRTTAPKTTRSMHAARESLGLDHLDVVHAGEHTFALTEGIRALAFSRLDADLEPL